MAVTLDQSEADFEARFAALPVGQARILARRRRDRARDHRRRARRGDAALIDYTAEIRPRRPCCRSASPSPRPISPPPIRRPTPTTVEALKFARDRIRVAPPAPEAGGRPLCRRGRRRARLALDGDRGGRPLRARRHGELSELRADERRPGRASPASSASSWRCRAPGGVINPLVLVAADLAGVSEIYRVGGAQAIAALAYGTETIRPVAKIVGPGNAYVAAAKRQVFGTVGIDMIAGPSEVLVVADARQRSRLDRRRPSGPGRARRLGAVDPDHRRCRLRRRRSKRRSSGSCRRCRARRTPRRAGATSARSSWSTTRRRDCRWSTASRPSMSSSPSTTRKAFLPRMRNAGAVFLGRHTPEVIGDYVGGSNHVLPTARSARFSSGLSVLDFMKRTSVLKLGPEQLARACARGDRSRQGRGARRAWALGRHTAQHVGHGTEPDSQRARLIDVELDDTIGRSTPDVEHERAVAIFDLIEENRFLPGQRYRRRAIPAEAVAGRGAARLRHLARKRRGRSSRTSCR